MINDKKELQIGKVIINQKPHFKQELKITKIDNTYVYSENTVMPIEFYLNKYQFSIK